MAKRQRPKRGDVAFSWLYLDEEEIQRAEDLIASFKEDDAADSLGLGTIADRFAEKFYPALTTPMTHARYFIFIPTLFRQLEQGRHARPEMVRAAAKELQLHLRKRLGNVEGNIGRRSTDVGLKKWPSTIYWRGLRSLGILKPEKWAERHFYRAVAKRDDDAWMSDEQVAHDAAPSAWDDKCPMALIDGKSKPTFRLTVPEARYLRGRFREEHPDSLIGLRLKVGDAVQTDFPWEVSSPQLRRELRQAQAFSAMARGLTLVYYVLVHEMRNKTVDKRKAENVRAEFKDWHKATSKVIRAWKVDELERVFPNIQPADLRFLREARSAVLGCHGNIDRKLRQLVEQREERKKPNKRRLKKGSRYLATWTRPKDEFGSEYAFDFRHSKIGQPVVWDILAPLKRSARVQG